MNLKAIHTAFLSMLLAGVLCACGGENKPGQAPVTGDSGDAALNVKTPPGGKVSPAAGIDTSDGTLVVTGGEFESGTWSFKDVTAYIDERPGGGTTESVLELEAHDGPAKKHFRLRVHSGGGPLTVGTYPVGVAKQHAEGRFETGTLMFNSLFGGEGTVELTQVDSAHVTGTFNLTIHSPSQTTPTDTIRTNTPTSPKESLKGRFSQKLK